MSYESQPMTEPHEDEPTFDLGNLPPVPDAPRTVGPALTGALGLLLIGAGGAIGSALWLGAPPFDGLAASAMKLGVSPGITAACGVVAVGVALTGAGLASLMRRTIDTLDLASDPLPLLERVEHRILRLEDHLRGLEQRTARDLRAAVHPVAERLGSLEASVVAASEAVAGSDPSSDAVWRLAASMDQIRAQLDQRLEQQLTSYEQHLAAELARASDDHVAVLERALSSAREQVEQGPVTHGERPEVHAEPAVQAPTAAPQVSPAPAPAPAAAPAPAPAPVVDARHAAPPPAAAAPPVAHDSSLGVFDQLDDHGQPKAPVPTPADVPESRTPTEPMPDIYGGAERLPDLDSVAAVRPKGRSQAQDHQQHHRG